MTSGRAEPQPDQSTTGRHLPALDGIRGIAILLVLGFHLFTANTQPSASPLVDYLAKLRDAGWIGVDLFFVLSGFLITGILYDTRKGKHYFRNFYARRVLRIFPLYYATLGLVAVAVVLAGCHLLPGFWVLVAYLTSVISDAGYSTCPWLNLNHFWTLSVEELFYMVWPALIFLARTPRRIILLAVFGSAVSIALRTYFVVDNRLITDHYAVYSFAPARLDSLLAGSILAIGLRTRAREYLLKSSPFVLSVGLLTIAGLLVRWPTLPWDGGAAWAIGLYDLLAITFGALIATSLCEGTTKRILSASVLRFFGRYSYGMYVFHVILAGVLDLQLRAMLHAWTGSLLISVVGSGLVLAILTTVVAVASFHLYERHWLLLKRHFEDHTSAPKLRDVVS